MLVDNGDIMTVLTTQWPFASSV